jgi:hypothetical protein
MSGIDRSHLVWPGLASYSAPKSLLMPKILHIFKGRKRRNTRLRRALGASDKGAAANIIQFPQVMRDVEEEYPDYEVISRWLRLADEMLGSADQPGIDDYDGNSRKKA